MQILAGHRLPAKGRILMGHGLRRADTLDPDALAYIAAVETADGEPLEAGVKTAINAFVAGCKSDGIWDALKASCILAGARTLSGALVPLKGTAPDNFNFVPEDYNRITGLKGDGATKYLDSNRANDADPQDSQHLAVFITEPGATTASTCRIGGSGGNFGGTSGSSLILDNRFRSRSSARFPSSLQASDPFTLLGVSRESASSVKTQANGVNTNHTFASETPTGGNLFVFSGNFVLPELALDRMPFYSIGEAIDLAALDTRVTNLMTAIDGAIT